MDIRFPGGGLDVSLVDTTFDHDRHQALIWNIRAEKDLAVQTEISYFTSGLTWSADYTVIANADESHAAIENFIRVTNHSGENYENAQVRVVVGSINLVEKIAQLANIPVHSVPLMEADARKQYRQKAVRGALDRARKEGVAEQAVLAASATPKAIIKEGLSEYFVYTIEGTETIPNGWSKRLRSFAAAEVPISVVYRYREREYGDQLMRLYLLRNDEKSKLGTTPLPNGQVGIFRVSADNGLSYLARQTIQYVPIGDRLELQLGTDADVSFELSILAAERDEIWLKMRKPNVFKRVGDGTVAVDHRARVAGWNERVTFARKVVNSTRRPIRLEVRRAFVGDAVFRSALELKRHDFQTVEFAVNIAPEETLELLYEVIFRRGRNEKQSRLHLEHGEVARPTRL